MGTTSINNKYYFDLKTGHYRLKPLNEADGDTGVNNNATQTQQTQNATSEEQTSTEEQTTAPTSTSKWTSFNSDSQIQQLQAQVNEINRLLNNDIQSLKKQKEAIIKSIKPESDNSVYDPYQGKTIKIDELIEDKTWVANQKIHNLQKKINARIEVLAKQTKSQQVSESFKKFNVPEKYLQLNESNMSNAKIYIDDLIDKEDEDCPIRNMNDFKRAFKGSNLIIGKENGNSSKQNKYFVICVDEHDVNELQHVLNSIGYINSEIVETIMPQILDRKKFV